MRYLWVIEMGIKNIWYATIGVKLNRSEARMELKYWKKSNPNDKFRIRKYVPEVKE